MGNDCFSHCILIVEYKQYVDDVATVEKHVVWYGHRGILVQEAGVWSWIKTRVRRDM